MGGSPESIFGRPIAEWTPPQRVLYNWICTYYNIMFELPVKERPPSRVLNDDLRMNIWLREYDLKQRGIIKEKTGNKNHGNRGGGIEFNL